MPYIAPEYYDVIYSAVGKDYKYEVRRLQKVIRQFKKSRGKRLLDTACGTGIHASLLSRYYEVEGLDLDPAMVAIARKNHPGIRFRTGDMVDFQLNQEYDVVTCLFSAIGHVRTKTRLRKAIRSMAAHLVQGGVLIVEPWFTPDQWYVGNVGSVDVDMPGFRLVRMSHSGKRRGVSIIQFEYLVGTPRGIHHFSETLELGLFEEEDYLEAFGRAGLTVTHDPEGVDGRGLYIGQKT